MKKRDYEFLSYFCERNKNNQKRVEEFAHSLQMGANSIENLGNDIAKMANKGNEDALRICKDNTDLFRLSDEYYYSISSLEEYNSFIEEIKNNDAVVRLLIQNNSCSYSECDGEFPPEYELIGIYINEEEEGERLVDVSISANIENSILEEINSLPKEKEYEY